MSGLWAIYFGTTKRTLEAECLRYKYPQPCPRLANACVNTDQYTDGVIRVRMDGNIEKYTQRLSECVSPV